MKTLEHIRQEIIEQTTFSPINLMVDKDILILEEPYRQEEWEKNDDDCYDAARENGEEIVEKFPELEMTEYLCHRHKYAVTYFELKG